MATRTRTVTEKISEFALEVGIARILSESDTLLGIPAIRSDLQSQLGITVHLSSTEIESALCQLRDRGLVEENLRHAPLYRLTPEGHSWLDQSPNDEGGETS